MKYLPILILTLFISNVHAETCSTEQAVEKKDINTDVPSHLKGAVIIIRQADGRESSAPAEQFKVVPRKQQFLVTKSLMTCHLSENEKNRISILGGFGPNGTLHKDESALNTTNTVKISTKESLVGGVQYQRKVSKDLSIGIQGQSNKTASFILGIDF